MKRRLRRGRRRPLRRRRHRRVFGRSRIFPRVMQSNPSPVKYNLPVARIFRTVLTCDAQGQIPTGSGPIVRYQIKHNSLFAPFGTGLPIPFTTTSGITPISLMPAGYHNFMTANNNGFYTESRVLASSIFMQSSPISGLDHGRLVISPLVTNANLYANSFTAAAGPYSKTKMLIVNSADHNHLSNYISVKALVGSLKSSVIGEEDYAAGADADPVIQTFWQLTFQTCDGLVTASPIPFRIRVKYWVQFEGGTTVGLNDT